MRKTEHERMPLTQAAASGSPPKPPKRTSRNFQDPEPGGEPVYLPDPVVVLDLAPALNQKPFKVVAPYRQKD